MRSAQFVLGGAQDSLGAAVIAFGDHQAARNGADIPVDEAGMMIEDKTVDPGVAEPGLRPGQADRVVGAEQLSHSGADILRNPPPSALRPAYVRHLTRSVILCSLASRRVKPRKAA